jgi:putative ABC transport system ATP-binding protein
LLLRIHRARKSTLVLVTHDPEIAAIADLTISLRDGQVVASTERPSADRRALMTGTDDSD